MRLKYWYFRITYFLGFKAHVYDHISGMIATDKVSDWVMAVNGEAWDYQKILLARGWHECPHCLWATKKKGEHILKGEGYCYEQSLKPAPDEAHRRQMLIDQLGENPMTWQ